MLNFEFKNPTKLFSVGWNCKISREIENRKILVLYGGSIKSNGVYDQKWNLP